MMPAKLVANGKLTVPLFHGTSTLFSESIRNTGLGSRNMVEELGLRAIARVLLGHEKELEGACNWELEKLFLLKVADDPLSQKLTGHSGFSFRYGGTYVTPSRQTAARYALSNNSGSEALDCTLKLIHVLLSQLPELANQEPFSKVLQFSKTARRPVVVEAHDVPVTSLRAEQGGDCAPVLEFIEPFLSDPQMYEIMVQQSNFELVSPIPSSQLRFYEILSPDSANESFSTLRLVPLT